MRRSTRKRCSKCGAVKFTKQGFSPRPDRRCGYSSQCRECLRKAAALRVVTPEERARRRAKTARYDAEHPDQKRRRNSKYARTLAGKLAHAKSDARRRRTENKTEAGRESARRIYELATAELERVRARRGA